MTTTAAPPPPAAPLVATRNEDQQDKRNKNEGMKHMIWSNNNNKNGAQNSVQTEEIHWLCAVFQSTVVLLFYSLLSTKSVTWKKMWYTKFFLVWFGFTFFSSLPYEKFSCFRFCLDDEHFCYLINYVLLCVMMATITTIIMNVRRWNKNNEK